MAIPLLIEITKVANKKRDEALSLSSLQEIQTLVKKMKQGMQAKTLLSVSSEVAYLMKTESYLMLQTAVGIINGLSEIMKDQSKPITYRGETYWENPDNFLSGAILTNAFSVQGEIALQDTLSTANRFRDTSLQMMARLASIERAIKKGPPKIEKKEGAKKVL